MTQMDINVSWDDRLVACAEEFFALAHSIAQRDCEIVRLSGLLRRASEGTSMAGVGGVPLLGAGCGGSERRSRRPV